MMTFIKSVRQKAYEEGVVSCEKDIDAAELEGRQAVVEEILAELPKERIELQEPNTDDERIAGFNECLSAIRDLIEKKLSN